MNDHVAVNPARETDMGSYRITVRRKPTGEEFSVMVQDEAERSLAELGAFSALHAQKVARDLMSLVRKSDPDGAFTMDVREHQPYF